MVGAAVAATRPSSWMGTMASTRLVRMSPMRRGGADASGDASVGVVVVRIVGAMRSSLTCRPASYLPVDR